MRMHQILFEAKKPKTVAIYPDLTHKGHKFVRLFTKKI